MEIVRKEIKEENASFLQQVQLGGKEKRVLRSYKKQHDQITESPKHALEFLSRSWSPAASNFLQMFSANKQLLPGDTKEQDDENLTSANTPNAAIMHDNSQMDFNRTKTWLTGKSLTRLLRSHKEKKKEERRLHTAELHTALSLTQLAAAIAGISSSTATPDNFPFPKGTPGMWEQDMGSALASAAALVTTACAEAAESLGAKKAQVRAAVDSGMSIQSPLDMMAVTAKAATCLRGAALLKSRAMGDPLSRVQEMLKIGAQICIIMPSGRKECAGVSIYLKRDYLMFSFRKKYFGGAFTSAREYKVTKIIEERLECQENSFLCLTTKNGIIKLFFEDEMQSRLWISIIFNLVEMRNTYGQARNNNICFQSSNLMY